MNDRIESLMKEINVLPGELFIINVSENKDDNIVCFISEDCGYSCYSMMYEFYSEENECGDGFSEDLQLLVDLLAGAFKINDIINFD